MTFKFEKVIPYMNFFLEGLAMTIFISLLSVFFGTILGFFVSLLRRSKSKIVRGIVSLYVALIRGIPLLVQIYIGAFALPFMGFRIPDVFGIAGSSNVIVGVMVLSINSSAYVAEIFRGGLESVDKGVIEASRSLGLSSSQTMKQITLPLALKVVLPALGNEFVTMIKESSIVSVVNLYDLTYVRNVVTAATFRVSEPLIVIAVLYFALTTTLSFCITLFERRLNKNDRS